MTKETAQNKPKPSHKTAYPHEYYHSLTKKQRALFFIGIGVFFVGLILFAAYLLGVGPVTRRPQIPESDMTEEEQFLSEAVLSEKTYQEIKAENPELLSTPNISNKMVKDTYIKASNPNPKNITILFTGGEFIPNTLTINQGDLVTFENVSQVPLKIQGEGWESVVSIEHGERYSQEFDILGSYTYNAAANDEFRGVITVIASP